MLAINESSYGDGVICTLGFPLPSSQNDALISLQRQISDKSEIQYNFSENLIPIIRLYECVLPIDKVEKAKREVQRLASSIRPFSIDWREIEETVHSIILWGERNPVLIDFQDDIVKTLQPYRQGYYKHKYASEEYLTPEEKKSVEMWGWPWVESYEPYVVIAKSVDQFQVGSLNLTWEFNKVKVDTILFAEKTGHQFMSPEIFSFVN